MLQFIHMDFSQLKDKTTLITGVAGFIGCHLSEAVLKNGGKVIGVDNFITGQRKHVGELKSQFGEQFTFIEADVTQDPHQYLEADPRFHKDDKIDYVLHFASPASPPRYQEHPVETYLVNSMGTHQLLSYLLAEQPNATFLFASTSEIYGDPQQHPQKEGYWGNVNPNGVRSCYDESKRMGETICGVFQREFNLDVRMVRIFNTYGPRIDLADGRVIPNFISSMMSDKPLTIYGDGSQTRSYCYVDDLVEGILGLLVHADGNGKTVNLGNPGEFTILETIKIFEKIAGHPLQTETKSLPKDDPTRRQPDISLAKELLGWEPKVSFEDGLRKTIEYFQASSVQ